MSRGHRKRWDCAPPAHFTKKILFPKGDIDAEYKHVKCVWDTSQGYTQSMTCFHIVVRCQRHDRMGIRCATEEQKEDVDHILGSVNSAEHFFILQNAPPERSARTIVWRPVRGIARGHASRPASTPPSKLMKLMKLMRTPSRPPPAHAFAPTNSASRRAHRRHAGRVLL